jgi:hypothetical protein
VHHRISIVVLSTLEENTGWTFLPTAMNDDPPITALIPADSFGEQTVVHSDIQIL